MIIPKNQFSDQSFPSFSSKIAKNFNQRLFYMRPAEDYKTSLTESWYSYNRFLDDDQLQKLLNMSLIVKQVLQKLE